MSANVVKNVDSPIISVAEGTTRKILAHREDLMMVEVHFETGAVGAVHTHPHTQCSYVLSGKFEFVVEGETVVVEQGDTLCFEPNQPHGSKCLEKGVLLDVFSPMREDFLKK